MPIRRRAHRDDEQVAALPVGDERLGAVDDVIRAVTHRRRADAGKVAAGAGFGHRDAEHRLAGDHAGQPALLLLGCRQVGEIRQHDIVLQGEGDRLGRRAGPLQFVDDDRVVAEVVDPRAAEVFGHREPQQPKLSRLGEQGAVPLAVPFRGFVQRDHRLLDEIADQLPELVVFGRVFQRSHGSAEGVAAGERLAEDELVHLGRALVCQYRFQVDHVPDDRVLQRYPIAAQYRSRGPADLDRLSGVVQLAEADLFGSQPPASLSRPRCSDSSWPLCSSTAMSTSFAWVSWNPAIGRPNWVRCIA